MDNKDKKEQTRNVVNKIDIRSAQDNGDNTATLEGYIAKFNSPTELWQGYIEQIDPHAFDNTLADGHNIFLLYAHDWSKPLASTGTGTFKLNTDKIGLHFVATVDTSISYVKDVVALVKSGLTPGCSFGFYVTKDDELYDAINDTITDTLLEIELLEGSILSDPQYTDTEVSARAKNKIEEYRKKQESEKELELIKIELDLN